MKKILILLFGLFLVWKTHAQKIVVNVKNIQTFEHPFMSTNSALEKNLVTYFNSGKTNATYIFDLEKMILKKYMNNVADSNFDGQHNIIDKIDDTSILNVFVKFSDGKIGNFILQRENDGKKTFICRWGENEKIVGWFDSTL